MVSISERAQTIQASPIRRLVPLADAAKKQGKTVYHLNIGQPDIPTPEPMVRAIQTFDHKVISYGHSEGLLDLRIEIAKYFQRYGIPIKTEEVLVTIAGSEAIHFAFCAVADVGDEIIIPEPFYTNYNGFATFAQVKIVPVTTKAEEGFHLPPMSEIEAKITSRTRAILLCSPNNPTGTIYTPEELAGVAELVRRHNLFLIGDEVYKEFAYDGQTHMSILELPGLEDRTIVADSISKRFSACGARIGCLVCRNPKVIESITRFAQARLCPQTVEQVAAVAAYRMDPAYFDPIREEYQRRRDAMYEACQSIEGLVLKKPRGAFYMLAKLPIPDADDFARWLLTDYDLNHETVMVAPGNGFYATPGLGEDEIRLAYVLNVESIRRAMKVLEEGLKQYRTERNL
ncbi:MAG TPA: pyridoxal phosphate-dependent aminotransferase [Thermoanaerobaculia bacterium]|nr:pyridoxal phosphate-dependent aminotransferase [Thermoanaerobaculia bacterium]HXK69125.1 pyridoxal phosphate-dependent aminotransferase [Thermoanaerobaculia bacterium]